MMMASVGVAGGVLLGSALCTLLGGPMVIRGFIAQQWIQPIRYEDCPPLQPYQAAKRGTPTMGGLWVLAMAMLVAVLAGGLGCREGWVVLGAVIAMGLVGLTDDLLKLKRPNAKGLRPMPKLAATLIIGGIVGWLLRDPGFGYRQLVVPWTGTRVTVGWLWVPMAMGVVAGSAHAVNLTDGMDGLAAGCLVLAFAALGVWTRLETSPAALTIWCASLAGACAGFLWFNTAPASIFLGDVGALGLGAALGLLALLSHASLALVILGGVFVAEAVSVMLQVASYRWRNKRRIFRVAPLHHHFHLGGLSEQNVVVRFWIAGLLLAALGLCAWSR